MPPLSLSLCLSLLFGFPPPRLQVSELICIALSRYSSWPTARLLPTLLLVHYDPEVLPTKYGGKNGISLEPPKKAAAKGPPKGMSMTK